MFYRSGEVETHKSLSGAAAADDDDDDAGQSKHLINKWIRPEWLIATV